jgi:hypothetical protein
LSAYLWWNFAKREKLMTEETCAELKGELEALAKMITALIRGTTGGSLSSI